MSALVVADRMAVLSSSAAALTVVREGDWMPPPLARVNCRIWRDPVWRSLTPDGRMVWLYLLTCDQANAERYRFHFHLSLASSDLQADVARVRAGLDELAPEGVAYFDERSSHVWLPAKATLSHCVPAVGTAAMVVLLRLSVWCNAHGGDGWIPTAAARALDDDANAANLRRLARSRQPRYLECDDAARGYRMCNFGTRWADPRPTWSRHAYAEVFARDGRACRYCGGTEQLAVDHVIPRKQGGGDDARNLVVACKPCNSRKRGRTPEQAGMCLRPLRMRIAEGP